MPKQPPTLFETESKQYGKVQLGAYAQERLEQMQAERETQPPKPERKVSQQSLDAYCPGTAAQQRGRVLGAIKAVGDHGLTCDELAERWGVPPNQISGRFTELAGDIDDGPWIEKRQRNGRTITRKTRSGKAAAVWFAIREDYSKVK